MTKKEKDKLNLIDKKRLKQQARDWAIKEKQRQEIVEKAVASSAYESDDISIYADAKVEETTTGYWVESWVWVSKEQI